MKNIFYSSIFVLTILTFVSFTRVNQINTPTAIEIPINVQQIINKACYGCHNTASSNKKAKKKFDFDKLNFLKKQQVIAEWDKVAHVIIDGEMPPKKFNKKHPDKRLTMIDKQVLTDWIKTLSEVTTISLNSQLDNLTNQIISSLNQSQKNKIAIMEFVDMQGNVSNLGKYISEELTTRLYRTGKFEVIERQLLDKIVQEQKISLSGLVDESSAAELGRILGVDAIASGTLGNLGTSVKVNARLISVESGKLFSVASTEIPKNDKVKVLLSQKVTMSSSATAVIDAQTPSGQTVKKEGYIFELMEARLEDKTAICKIRVTNTTEEDKEFHITLGWQYQTMIYTDAGDESVFSRIKIGGKMNKIYGTSQYDAVTKKIFSGSSEVMEIYFDDISRSATKINLLQILTTYRNGFQIEFRNIPLKTN